MKSFNQYLSLMVLVVFISLICCQQQASSSGNVNDKLVKLTSMDLQVKETSGLARYNGQLITHNDKGGDNFLYVFKPNDGKISSRIEIANARNSDWEDLASENGVVYIADTGNNKGERLQFTIYAVQNIDSKSNTVQAQKINFVYENQTSGQSTKKHDFDCEAIIAFQNILYLFTKNRTNDSTYIYRLPAKEGEQTAVKAGAFHSQGRITGADISPDGKSLALLGYNKKSDCFVWLMDDFNVDQISNLRGRKIVLGAYTSVGQTEGITFSSSGKELFISSEGSDSTPPALYLLTL
jgi:hypothetical protein